MPNTITLVIAGLSAFTADEWFAHQPQAPYLTQFIQQSTHNTQLGNVTQWLSQRFGIYQTESMASAAILMAGQQPNSSAEQPYIQIEPVHIQVGINGTEVMPSAQLLLTKSEAQSIITTLNTQLQNTPDLIGQITALLPHLWCGTLHTESLLSPTYYGHNLPVDMEHQLEHTDPKLQQTRTLIEMLLHQHPINLTRSAQNLPTINSVVFSGAGKLPQAFESITQVFHTIYSNHAWVKGLAKTQKKPPAIQAIPKSFASLVKHPPPGDILIELDEFQLPAQRQDSTTWAAQIAWLDTRCLSHLYQLTQMGYRLHILFDDFRPQGKRYQLTLPQSKSWLSRLKPSWMRPPLPSFQDFL